MKGVIFDMDGVLIDAMPFHAEAMHLAIREETNHDIDKKLVYLFEGMPSPELVKQIFKIERIDNRIDDNIAEKISKRKKELFQKIQDAKSIEGAKELVNTLDCDGCIKAVVSGAARQEVETMLEKNIGLKNFDVVIAGDDLEEGKPDPEPFQTALKKMNLRPDEAIVVENAPLGVEAAIRAGIKYIITFNKTPLDISDFKRIMTDNKIVNDNAIFQDTRSTINFLKKWCCERHE